MSVCLSVRHIPVLYLKCLNISSYCLQHMVAYHPSTKQLREIPNGLRTGGGGVEYRWGIKI